MSPEDRLDRTLSALADPHRRRVVEVLGAGPLAAGALARAVGLSAPAMSRHLKTLKTAELIEERHPDFDARVRIYALRPAPMADLMAWLAQAERHWTEQLLALKSYLETPDP